MIFVFGDFMPDFFYNQKTFTFAFSIKNRQSKIVHEFSLK